jgi:phospholipase/carboxylesterase
MHDPANTLRFGRPLGQARGAVILIHGRGSSAEDIAGLADVLEAPDFAYLAPSADGGAWYPQRFHAPLEQNEPWLGSALETLERLATDVLQAGVPAERLAIAGFSQGACLALEHVVRTGRRYGFAAALSGALIGPLDTPRSPRDLRGLPILVACAEQDAHIPLAHVEHTAAVLAAMKAAVTWQRYPGAAHRIFTPEITWLKQQAAALRAAA